MTTTVEPDPALLRAVLRRETNRLADGLRGDDPALLLRPVPGLDWTAGQVVSHLCVVYRAFAATLSDEGVAGAGGSEGGGLGADGSRGGRRESGAAPERTVMEVNGASAASRPLETSEPAAATASGGDGLGEGPPQGGAVLQRTLAEMNEAGVASVPLGTPDEAAAALRESAAELLDALGSLEPGPALAAPCPTPWYGPGATRSAGTLAALSVTETLVHGHDLDRALGRPARIAADAAAAAAPTVMSAMLPLLVDAERVRGRRLGFEVRVRGGHPFVLRIGDGRAWAEPVGVPGTDAVDCVLSLTGEAALLTGFARRPVWRSVATGAALSWGRRPWLGPGFARLFLTV